MRTTLPGPALFAGAFMLASAALAAEQTGTERLFDSSSFDDVREGTTLTYAHTRSADANVPVRAVEDGRITVSVIADEGGTPRAHVTLWQGERRRVLDALPADRGNPVFVTFLESAVNAIAFATKGSPFYIRNRIKDAFATGGEISNETIEVGSEKTDAIHIDYRPFKGDRNADKLGAAFENLSIRFTLSEEVPGHFVALATEAKAGETVYFIESIRFTNAAEGDN